MRYVAPLLMTPCLLAETKHTHPSELGVEIVNASCIYAQEEEHNTSFTAVLHVRSSTNYTQKKQKGQIIKGCHAPW